MDVMLNSLNRNQGQVSDQDLDSFERVIEARAKRTRKRSLTIFERNNHSILPLGLESILRQRIYPILEIIGLERWVAGLIFHIAATAWSSIGPVHDKTIHIFPILQRQIDDIRLGVISEARREASGPSHFNTSWIVLPRAYRFLEVAHSRYILFYTNLLKGKEAIEFMKILIRVITEFLVNFALKYPEQPKQREVWALALFYAYVSMFWTNLLRPPLGLEDALVFECFFVVAKGISENFTHEPDLVQKEIDAMKRAKEDLFVSDELTELERDSLTEPWKFAITLRHGRAGIESCFRFFGPGAELLEKKTGGGLPYTSVPRALSTLLRELRRRWPSAGQKMRRSVNLFLTLLEHMYSDEGRKKSHSRGITHVQARYVRSRVLILIRNFRDSLEL